MKELIGIGIITYNRPERFLELINSIQCDGATIVAIHDGGGKQYQPIDNIEIIKLKENKGVGVCKNIAIDYLKSKNVEHYYILEDDCLITNNNVWRYCVDFSKHTGLLHFNWNNYRSDDSNHVIAKFPKFDALISYNVEANFSYFHKDFLKEIRFDENYVNAWEHVDLEYQGVLRGFLPAFRMFVSPANLSGHMRINDAGESTIVGGPLHKKRIADGYNYWLSKWNRPINDIHPIGMEKFQTKMKEITNKYAKR